MIRIADRLAPSHISGPVLGWISDTLRIFWGMFYWNFRKTRYRARNSAGHCPCQNLSDSGRAGETGCDASLHFDKPGRFRVVCPLLKPNADGKLKCSVNGPEVRPFWGRVIGLIVGFAVILYLVATLGAFGVMRGIGYPIELTTLVWPGNWSKINQTRSAYFLKKAETAYQAGNVTEAVMSLSLAYEYDPGNYEAGLLLANLWQVGRPEVSNHLYQQLLTRHPKNAPRTAQSWLRALLPRGDFGAIERLAGNALRFDPDFAPAWVHALLFSNERTGNAALLTQILESEPALSPAISDVLKIESEVRSRPVTFARELLRQVPSTDTPAFALYYRIRRLIEIGAANDALEMINKVSDRLSDRDRITLQLRAFASGDYKRTYETLFDQITRLPASLTQIELVSAHLIAHPNSQFYEWVKQRVDPMKIAEGPQQHAALVALFCLSGAAQDFERQNQLAAILRQVTGTQYAALTLVSAMNRDPSRFKIENVLPTLQPLSLELTYAMLERYETTSP